MCLMDITAEIMLSQVVLLIVHAHFLEFSHPAGSTDEAFVALLGNGSGYGVRRGNSRPDWNGKCSLSAFRGSREYLFQVSIVTCTIEIEGLQSILTDRALNWQLENSSSSSPAIYQLLPLRLPAPRNKRRFSILLMSKHTGKVD